MVPAEGQRLLRRPRILVIEDQEPIQALVKALLGIRKHTCDAALCIADARRLMATAHYDMLFVDVNLPDGSGLSLVEDDSLDSPLVIVMTGNGDLQTAISAIRHRAIDFITKPFSVGEFLGRVDRALGEWNARVEIQGHARALQTLVELKTEELSRTNRRIEEVHDKTVLALGAALKLKDNETEGHCVRVSQNSVELGTLLGLSAFELRNLKWGAYLHDVGKIGIPEHILLKPGPLTPEERHVMEMHPVLGYAMIRGIEFLVHSTDVVISHHERYDGGGYPHRLAGERIPLHARIFSVMDTLDAMTSERPYHAALPLAAAAAEVERLGGSQFDPEIVELFLSAPATTWSLQARAIS